MPRTHRPSVLFIGDRKHPEFRPALAWLYARADLECAPTCAKAYKLLIEAAHAPLEWMIFASPRRGVFRQQDVQRLHRAAPLAKKLHLTGSWCDGETRSGNLLAGLVRVSWRQWTPRATAEIIGHPQERYAGWSRGAAATVARAPRASYRQVGILAATQMAYLALADAATASGSLPARCHWSDAARYDALIVDGDSFDARLHRELASYRESAPRQPLVLLLDWPRWEDLAAARALRIDAVVGKPFLLGDLQHHLRTTAGAATRITAA